jgi:hypothetical protein
MFSPEGTGALGGLILVRFGGRGGSWSLVASEFRGSGIFGVEGLKLCCLSNLENLWR